MKTLPAILFLLTPLLFFGQEQVSIIRVQGFVYSPDSIPVENAYLISYQTLRAYATDKNGKFDILIADNDSLKVSHLSYSPTVIRAKDYKEPLKLYMQYELNNIDEVSIRLKNTDQINLEANMDGMLKELQNKYYYTCPKGNVTNSYAPKTTQSSEVGINIFELIKWIKYKRRHK